MRDGSEVGSAEQVSAPPRRPRDVPGHGPQAELLEAYWTHRLHRDVDGTHRCEALTSQQVVDDVLAELALAHELARRLLQGRWCAVDKALRAGATVAEVAAAMDLEDEVVRAGLRAWADDQQALHREIGFGLTAAQADGVRALVALPRSVGDSDGAR